MEQPMVTEALRLAYAQQIADTARLRSNAVRRAFAVVPREKFLGPGPWSILSWADASGTPGYTSTPDADPAHLYHDIVVAIDASRQLNNGQPSFLAFCLDSLDLKAGERVVHIGCGVGYYTAIIAEVIGPKGQVLGIEIDPKRAMCARDNLAYVTQAKVEQADASRLAPADADAILVNAGVTEIKRGWLEALKDGGRMLVPITTQLATTPGVELGLGQLLKRVRGRNGFSARFIYGVAIYHCAGARDARRDKALDTRFSSGGADTVRSLRVDAHEATGGCWFHADTFCLSTSEAGSS
jgi:protein-L-isoaspartate(D-aspartate) O-methyltransferase